MASYNDQQLFAAMQPHLQPGEQVRSIAYGTRGMPMWAQIICTLIIIGTLLPGLIIYLIWHYATISYFLLTLTDRRIIVVQVKGLAPVATWDYPLPFQGHISSAFGGWAAGKGFDITLSGAPRSFNARFLNSSGPTNMANAQTIAQAIGQSRMTAGAPGAPMGPPQMAPGMGAPQLGGPASGQPAQLPPQGGWGAPQGGPPQGGGYGPPPQGGGYGGPPPQGGGYGGPPPQGGGYGGPPQGGYGPPGGQGGPGQGGPGQGGGWGQG